MPPVSPRFKSPGGRKSDGEDTKSTSDSSGIREDGDVASPNPANAQPTENDHEGGNSRPTEVVISSKAQESGFGGRSTSCETNPQDGLIKLDLDAVEHPFDESDDPIDPARDASVSPIPFDQADELMDFSEDLLNLPIANMD